MCNLKFKIKELCVAPHITNYTVRRIINYSVLKYTMPAHHNIDTKNQLLITTWEGEARDIEFIEAIKKYQKNIQSHPDYINYNELVDFSNVTGIKLTTEGIRNIGTIASTTDQNEVNRKLAFIVNSSLAFGLARMYEAYRGFSKKAHKELRIFKNEKDAFEWVKK